MQKVKRFPFFRQIVRHHHLLSALFKRPLCPLVFLRLNSMPLSTAFLPSIQPLTFNRHLHKSQFYVKLRPRYIRKTAFGKQNSPASAKMP
jgi:hypothetical protein